ncbi:hypothetical protein [Flammeovirga sp. OC4]|uniref:hypothetical protein n=1 Tax=Flammeovirga sp. OC4 TaxID=1382345 RepID=UPI0005C77DC4|nr:hypothetical protein [Flammeovirga sp. OC4]
MNLIELLSLTVFLLFIGILSVIIYLVVFVYIDKIKFKKHYLFIAISIAVAILIIFGLILIVKHENNSFDLDKVMVPTVTTLTVFILGIVVKKIDEDREKKIKYEKLADIVQSYISKNIRPYRLTRLRLWNLIKKSREVKDFTPIGMRVVHSTLSQINKITYDDLFELLESRIKDDEKLYHRLTTLIKNDEFIYEKLTSTLNERKCQYEKLTEEWNELYFEIDEVLTLFRLNIDEKRSYKELSKKIETSISKYLNKENKYPDDIIEMLLHINGLIKKYLDEGNPFIIKEYLPLNKLSTRINYLVIQKNTYNEQYGKLFDDFIDNFECLINELKELKEKIRY